MEFIKNINSTTIDDLSKKIIESAELIKIKNSKNLPNYYFSVFLFFSKVFEIKKLKELLIKISETEKSLLSILGKYISFCLNKSCKELKYSVKFNWEEVNVFKRLSEILSHPYELEIFSDIVKLIFTIYQLDRKIATSILEKDKHNIVFSLFVYYYCTTFKPLEYKNFAKIFLKSNDYAKKCALILPVLEKLEKLAEDERRYCKNSLDDFTKREKEFLKIDCEKLKKELKIFSLLLYFLLKYIEDKSERAEIFLLASIFVKERRTFLFFEGFDNIIKCEEVEKVLDKVWNKSHKSALDFYKLLVLLDKELGCTSNKNIRDYFRSYLTDILNESIYENSTNLWKEIIKYLTNWNLKNVLINHLENKKNYIRKILTVDKYLHYEEYLRNKEKLKTYKMILDLAEEE